MLGDGDGSFESAQTILNVGRISAISTADFDGDGILDLVLDRSAPNALRVLLGQGDGTFVNQPTVPTPFPVFNILTTDFNGDGDVDLVVSGDNVETVLFSGDGWGRFTELPNRLPVGRFATATDFNFDGTTDVVTIDESSVAISLGLGGGTFEEPQSFLAGISLNQVVVQDLNDDGLLDLATSGFSAEIGARGGSVSVLLNQQSESFPLGDVNRDCNVNLLDVTPFIDLIVSQEFQIEADINMDGVVNLLDVNPFIDLLTN